MADALGPAMDILTWILVGLVAGVLASMVVGSGYGIIGDIVVGIVGAFIGGFVFRSAGWHTPFAGLAGTIFVAFIGAVILLVLLRLIHRGSGRGRVLP
ncbi:MAG: GlsB/YeaQ/YmgE family stress response membrane protein [Kofleriaceae bacterium]